MLTHGNLLIPEVAAAAATVFTFAMLFWVTACPASLLASSGFCIGLFVAYQMRPAYLFLIVLAPLLGVVLRYALAKHQEVPALLGRFGARLSALAFLPYLGFCLFRWRMVGHFGLISFGGMNVIGVAGQFLNDETIISVPAHLQPLAHKTLEIRGSKDYWPRDHAKHRLSFRQAEPLYNSVIYDQVLPAYRSLPDSDPGSADANRKCGELSWSLIKARPNLYLCWIGDAYRTGLLGLPNLTWYARLHTLNLHLLTIVGSLGLVRVVQRHMLGRVASGESRTPGFWFVCSCLALVGISFALSKLFLICLVEAPIPRYLDAVYLFTPTITGAITYGAIQAIWNHIIGTVGPTG